MPTPTNINDRERSIPIFDRAGPAGGNVVGQLRPGSRSSLTPRTTPTRTPTAPTRPSAPTLPRTPNSRRRPAAGRSRVDRARSSAASALDAVGRGVSRGVNAARALRARRRRRRR